MQTLLSKIKKCEICSGLLPYKPNPVLAAHADSKILIIGQAPGQKVHDSGTPWDDKSGDELRRWLCVTKEQFYDTKIFAIVPMGFCYPGKGTSGDLPPRPECAPTWHSQILNKMKNIKLTILIGSYSQKYYLREKLKPTLTETVKSFHEYLPNYFPLVHPSPRNRIWQAKNPWFEKDVVPFLKEAILAIV